jgi:hypothetical protein
MRSDSFLTKIGDRSGRGRGRLWLEDGFDRLSRNGFGPGTAFTVTPRGGVGLVLRVALLGSCHVSHRRRQAVLSYESPDLNSFLPAPSARVRISTSAIIVMPSLRVFSIGRQVTETWTVRGDILTTGDGQIPLGTIRPINFRQAPAMIEAEIDEANLVCATEVMGNAKAAAVRLTGDALPVRVAGQFLAAAGYARAEDGTTFHLQTLC